MFCQEPMVARGTTKLRNVFHSNNTPRGIAQKISRIIIFIPKITFSIKNYFIFLEDEDGLYLSELGQTHLTTLEAIRGEGEFFPIRSLVRKTVLGYAPDAYEIELMVTKYVNNGEY